MTFRFYDGMGTLLGGFSETQNVTVTQGVFNVLIGSATLDGVPETIFSGYPEVYLSVTVAGQELLPRQRIVSVGYAFRAGNAATADFTTTADYAVTASSCASAYLLDGPQVAQFEESAEITQAVAAHAASSAHDTRYYTKAQVDALMANMEARCAALETKLQYVTTGGTDMYITGANLHIRNGQGSTLTANGLGNLIVGYGELRPSGNVRTGSHNVLVGKKLNFSSAAGIVAGDENTISNTYACVTGKQKNTTSGSGATVSSGSMNTASGSGATVSGGSMNTASGSYGAGAGGGGAGAADGNEAFADYSVVSGGSGNLTGDITRIDHSVGARSSISGGTNNTASADSSSVSAGYHNAAIGTYASVVGGEYNTASGRSAMVAGGGYSGKRRRSLTGKPRLGLVPHPPLLPPIGNGDNRPDHSFVDRRIARIRQRLEKFLLDVGGEVEQFHDLRDARAGDVGETSEVGVVGDFAFVHELLHVDGEAHEAGNAGYAGSSFNLWRLAFLQHFPTVAPVPEVDLPRDR